MYIFSRNPPKIVEVTIFRCKSIVKELLQASKIFRSEQLSTEPEAFDNLRVCACLFQQGYPKKTPSYTRSLVYNHPDLINEVQGYEFGTVIIEHKCFQRLLICRFLGRNLRNFCNEHFRFPYKI